MHGSSQALISQIRVTGHPPPSQAEAEEPKATGRPGDVRFRL